MNWRYIPLSIALYCLIEVGLTFRYGPRNLLIARLLPKYRHDVSMTDDLHTFEHRFYENITDY